jgi:hypothetical protein
MGFNLSAFIGGAAEQANTLVDEERAQQKEIVVMRLKKAAESKALYNKKVEAQREEVKSTYRDLSSHEVFNNLTDDQQVSILKSPTIAADFLKQAQTGNVFDVATRYKFKTPEATQSAQSFVEGFGTTAPTRDVSEQMKQLGTGILSKSTDFAQSAATAYGDTLEGLLPYEGAEAPDIAPMASFAEGAFAKPETLEARLEKARRAFADATTPEDKAAAEAVAKSIQVAMDVGQDPKDLKAYADKLSIQVMNASTPADKQAALNKLNRVNAQIKSNGAAQAQEKDRADEEGKKALTFPQLRSSVDGAVGSAIGQIAGSDKLAIKLEDGTIGYRKPRKGDLPELVIKAREATISFLNTNGYLNEDGSPKTAFAKAILSADGYYGGTAPPQGGLPTPTTQEEYDAIPSGTRYTDTDGKVKTKS